VNVSLLNGDDLTNMLGQQIIDTNANRSARMGERRE